MPIAMPGTSNAFIARRAVSSMALADIDAVGAAHAEERRTVEARSASFDKRTLTDADMDEWFLFHNTEKSWLTPSANAARLSPAIKPPPTSDTVLMSDGNATPPEVERLAAREFMIEASTPPPAK